MLRPVCFSLHNLADVYKTGNKIVWTISMSNTPFFTNPRKLWAN
jgi:hypothetical protein